MGSEFSTVSCGTSVAVRVPGKPAAGKTTADLTCDVRLMLRNPLSSTASDMDRTWNLPGPKYSWPC
jgi:hypothetical protein